MMITVFAVYCPGRKGYIGSHFYISDMPKFYHKRGTAQNKADKMLQYFGEKCEVKEFELVERTD